MTSPQPANPFSQPPVDPLLTDRLARLQQLKNSRSPSSAPRPAAKNAPAGQSGRPSAPVATRRRHPAKKSRIAALALSVTTTGGLTALLSYVDHTYASATVTQTATSGTGVATAPKGTAAAVAAVNPVGETTAASSSPAVAVHPAGTTATSIKTAAAAAGATYTGQSIPNRYGNVQVQITVANGTITQSAALQAPTSDRKSVSINSRAVPALNTETTQAQSANIQIVSGATYTSNGYGQSLQSAIDQAVAAGALAG